MTEAYKKYRDPLELFLDDGFSNAETSAALRDAGFVVHAFEEMFPREGDADKREESIKDPAIIKLCHEKRWLLVTTDKEMCRKHSAEIRKHSQVTIIATAHNGLCLPNEWVQGLIVLRDELARMFKKRPRPWFVLFNRAGVITATRDAMFHK